MRLKKSWAHMNLLALATAGLAMEARSEILASESFDYTLGDGQAGLNGGTGWSGPWTNHSGGVNTIDVGEGLIFDEVGLGGRRKATSSDSRLGRSLTTPAAAADNDIFIGFIAQDAQLRDAGSASGFTLFDGGANGSGGAERLFVGTKEIDGQLVWYANYTQTASEDVIIGDGVDGALETFVLLSITSDGTSTDVTIDLYTDDDLTTIVASDTFTYPDETLSIGTIRLARDLEVDEIVLATTREEIVPSIPFSGSLTLLDFSYDASNGNAEVSIQGEPNTAYFLLEADDLDFSSPDQNPVPLDGATIGLLDGNEVVTNGSGSATIQFNLGTTKPTTFLRVEKAP